MAAMVDPQVEESRREVEAGQRARAAALHERLVAAVHARAAPSEPRDEVWIEHSYSRAGAGPAAPSPRARELLAPPAPSPREPLDVVATSPPPPDLDPDSADGDGGDEDEDEDEAEVGDWEARLAELAPGAAHARLAAAAGAALRDLRLARLAAGGRAAARRAARRLRAALAPHWPAAGWLHAALTAVLPRAMLRAYGALLGELARSAPRLAARLAGAGAAPREDPTALLGPPVGPESGPWLVWVSGGDAAGDRWARRLGALLHVRVLAPPAPGPGAAPAAWAAALAGAARAQLQRALGEAGRRGVAVGGAGAGAALAAALGGERPLLLLAPPLLAADGAAPPAEGRALLLVTGSAQAQCWAGAALEASAGAGRRLLRVRGADDRLRVAPALRRRLRLDQNAIDAAIAEECARWVLEACEPAAAASAGNRSIEIVEGRVVSRVCGATPLALVPPRRSPPPLGAADIMQLPIVFADDEPVSPAGPPAPRSCPPAPRSGPPAPRPPAPQYTRVIVAKRGRGGPLLVRRPLRVVPTSSQ